MKALPVASFCGCFCSIALPGSDGLFYPARSFFAGLDDDVVVAVLVDGVYQGFFTADAALSFARNPPLGALLVSFGDLAASSAFLPESEVA